MPRLLYGKTTIEWQFQPDARLKRHYVTVERGRPILLRGPCVDLQEQECWFGSVPVIANRHKGTGCVSFGAYLIDVYGAGMTLNGPNLSLLLTIFGAFPS
jgi:hypothetical protein